LLARVLYGVADGKKAQEEIASIFKEHKIADYPQQARIVVEALSQLPELKKEQLKTAQGLLADLKGSKQFVEVHYVERLAAFATRVPIPKTFARAKIKDVWQTMREREAVLAALAREPEFLLPWVKSAIEEADKNRRVAEAKLFWERPPVWEEAHRDLQLSGATYRQVMKMLEGMQTGSAALDRAFAELPVHLRTLCDGPDADLLAEKTWFKAAEEAAYLQQFFVAPPNASNVADAGLDTHGRDLMKHLDELLRLFRVRLKSAENAETPAAQRQLRCLLQSPRFKAAERADLIKKLRHLAKKLHDATETDDQPAPRAAERNAGPVRANMSLALLRLAGIEPDGPDEKSLRYLWGAKGLVERWGAASHFRQRLAISRLVSPWDPDTKVEDHGRLRQTKLREWLKEQYSAESHETHPRDWKAGDTRDQEIRDFYRDAAE
jgi:hypothetical protein